MHEYETIFKATKIPNNEFLIFKNLQGHNIHSFIGLSAPTKIRIVFEFEFVEC